MDGIELFPPPSASSSAPSGAAGGDLSGTYPNPTVAKLNGVAAAAYAPLASPTFTGTVTLPSGLVLPASVSIPSSAAAVTQSAGDNSTKVATTAYADLKLAKASNLSDLASASTARTNLGVTSVATLADAASAGQQIVWNGSAWISVTAPPSNGGGGTNGFLAQSFPVETASGALVAVTGTKYVIRVPLPYSITFTTVWVSVVTAGSGLTSSQNLISVYDSTGTKIGSTSADQSAVWNSSGVKSATVGAPGAQTGSVYIELLSNGTTPATFARSTAAATLNANLTGANLRCSTNGTGATAVDASITPASLSTSNSPIAYWVGLS